MVVVTQNLISLSVDHTNNYCDLGHGGQFYNLSEDSTILLLLVIIGIFFAAKLRHFQLLFTEVQRFPEFGFI